MTATDVPSTSRSGPGAPAPIVLFLPALDEEATVAEVVRRAPATVLGHPVEVVVVDDGSTDRTAELARAAGADVVSLGTNQGLGAAVARGLAEAVARGAAVVAFADADGEYSPEELAVLAAPILADEADYVVGSRFASGGHRNMRPHRRLGNVVLTRTLARLAKAPITDGQSGYRALSGDAAAAAHLEHAYNYAQVLTLDLLGKGFRYAEVPISYRFRSEGESFVRLGPYLRAVVPAVWRVRRRGTSSLATVAGEAPVDAPDEVLGRVHS
jgi:glycosyltransferase involved in cell wall biosynthesis